MPSAFHFDPNRCTGCQACELACSIENDLGPDRSWREVVTFNASAIPGVPRFHLSLACNHCTHPACMHSCPALAYSRDDSTGAVLIDPDRCIGCKYCAWACPYGAPRFEAERGVMGKCTFCSHRLVEGLKPACATLCPTGALDFAEIPTSELEVRIEGFPQTDLGPRIRIEPARRTVHQEGAARTISRPLLSGPSPATLASGITLRSEWSLAAFTFLTALLFALFVGATAGTLRVPATLFASGAALAAAFSLSHLGRPERAWRAGLNLRRSWLSREVAGFGTFVAGGTAVLAGGGSGTTGVGALVALVGLFTLVSADQVYRPVYRGSHPLVDGGGTLLTGLFLAGLLLGNPWLAGTAGSVKAGSMAVHAVRTRGGSDDVGNRFRLRGPLGLLRVALGLALPAAAWIAWGSPLPTWVILGAIAGEAIGRATFYQRLQVRSPARQVRADLAGWLASSAT
jgi:DMSO reductase iron-sulfur subunit